MSVLEGPPTVASLVRRGLLVEHPSGPTLAEVLRARVPLTDGEAATVAIPLAETLDELHGDGLAYGPPAADQVVFVYGGRPVLVVPPAWATAPDDDVAGLVRLVLAAMAPALPAEDDEPGFDDEPDLRPVLGGLLDGGCRTGAEVVRACFDTVMPEPVRLPDAGALARAHVLAPGAGTRQPSAPLPRRSSPGRPTVDRGSAPPAGGGGSRRAGRQAARVRARRRTRARAALVLVAALAAVVVLVARPAVVRADAGAVRTPAPVVVDPVLDRKAPADAAAALSRKRAAALAAGVPAGLDAVDVAGGPARAADEALLASVGADRLDGLSVDVQASDEVAGSGPDDVRVVVTSAMSPYRRVGESGTVAVPGTAPRTVVLELRWTANGWRVWQVSEPATP